MTRVDSACIIVVTYNFCRITLTIGSIARYSVTGVNWIRALLCSIDTVTASHIAFCCKTSVWRSTFAARLTVPSAYTAVIIEWARKEERSGENEVRTSDMSFIVKDIKIVRTPFNKFRNKEIVPFSRPKRQAQGIGFINLGPLFAFALHGSGAGFVSLYTYLEQPSAGYVKSKLPAKAECTPPKSCTW